VSPLNGLCVTMLYEVHRRNFTNAILNTSASHHESTNAGSTYNGLLKGIRARDEQAWKRFVDEYSPLIYVWCRKCDLQSADARDVSQQVFHAVSRSIATFLESSGNGSFRGLLFTITRNLIRNHLTRTHQRCLACHQVERGESNFLSYYDFTELSGATTDIGYPVDSLIALARMDKSYGNAFDSAKVWLDERPQWAGYLMFKIEHVYFEEQQLKAERRVTPGAVTEAVELDTLQRSSRVDGKVVRDLMLSVRGEGPDAKATVFSPVVDILKLAAESKETHAAKDIAELDRRLVALSEQHQKSIEVGIAATVFAILRNDLDSAKNRLKRLQAITDYPKSDGAAFWLAERHALQHDQTRILGAVLAERGLTAAETQPDSGLK
jgi:hypothetical protein